MSTLALREFHAGHGARFTQINGWETVGDYGDWLNEHAALRRAVGLLDLSFRGRLCLLGADRERFLNGQVTNHVKALKAGEGCYGFLLTAKGKLQGDLNLYRLPDEFLLDFEPGLTAALCQRFETYIIADDVQTVDVAAAYGLLSAQGPQAAAAVAQLDLGVECPAGPFAFSSATHATFGEIYVMNQPRAGAQGFDLFVPMASLRAVAEKLSAAVRALGGGLCGWQALETARIEAALPRYGADMDETNLGPETGLEARAISYTKGCYIGQEIVARLRTYGEVTKALRGLRLADDLPRLPAKGDRLLKDGKEVGYVTSAVASPALRANIALGYVRREVNQVGSELTLETPTGPSQARIVPLPFGSDTTAK